VELAAAQEAAAHAAARAAEEMEVLRVSLADMKRLAGPCGYAQ